MTDKHKITDAVQELRKVLDGKLALPADEEYKSSLKIWNAGIKSSPAFIVICLTAKDVQSAILVAATYQIKLTVRGGGHDWAGRSLNDGGMVIDVTRLKTVLIDQVNMTATIGGGVTIGDLVEALKGYELIAATGSISAVGMVGLASGGGYGPLGGILGMALDNVLSADIVLADGRKVNAGKNENTDLFWALRGGGGNFGVIVSMTIKLHAAQPLTSGMILYRWADAAQVLSGLVEVTDTMPDKLSLLAGVISDPEGNPVLFVSPTWYGEPAGGHLYIDRIKSLSTPIFSQIGQMPYHELIALYDTQIFEGLEYSANTRWFSKLTPEVIRLIIESCTTRTSPNSFINFHFSHGLAARIPLAETAFGIRQEHFVLEIIAAWEPKDNNNRAIHALWAKHLANTLEPYSLPGGYPNTLGPDEDNQIARAYGSNLERLRSVKDAYDPDRVFTAQPLPLLNQLAT